MKRYEKVQAWLFPIPRTYINPQSLFLLRSLQLPSLSSWYSPKRSTFEATNHRKYLIAIQQNPQLPQPRSHNLSNELPPAPRENRMPSMEDRTNWTRAMLERLRELHSSGLSENDITNELFHEFGAPIYSGEVKSELSMLKRGKPFFLYFSF